jgi:hypothetical protein
MDTALVNQEYLLKKFPGKGGWTYAEIPEIPPDPHAHFGWVKVRGSIDGFEFDHYHLMPMGNGKLFLPVKASIRKAIKKQAGDSVHVIIFKENISLITPSEILECIKEAGAFEAYEKWSDARKREKLDWIAQAVHDETRVNRIVTFIDQILSESGG